MQRAEDNIIQGIKDERIETEPSVTDRFLREIELIFEEHGERENIRFRARTLRDRGPNAPEREFGADFCGVLDVNLPEFDQTKGFLSQAKWERNGIEVNRGRWGFAGVTFNQNQEFQRLKEQANNMLSVTPDSFVIVYSKDGFVVVPASGVQGLNQKAQIYGKPVDRFFKEFLMCFIGDPRLTAHDDGTLRRLRDKTESRSAILFEIKRLE